MYTLKEYYLKHRDIIIVAAILSDDVYSIVSLIVHALYGASVLIYPVQSEGSVNKNIASVKIEPICFYWFLIEKNGAKYHDNKICSAQTEETLVKI